LVSNLWYYATRIFVTYIHIIYIVRQWSQGDGKITLRCIFGRCVNGRWLKMVQDHIQWWALVLSALNLRVLLPWFHFSDIVSKLINPLPKRIYWL
jgi:hypothetical protein